MGDRQPAYMLGRDLPSFEQWLSDNGNGSRGDGFEAFEDLIRRARKQDIEHLTEEEQSLARLWGGLSIAIVEICNIEHQRGRTAVEIIKLMPRALAIASVYATASVLVEDTPWRAVAKVLTEEFRWAAKTAADDLTTRPRPVQPEGDGR